MPPASRGADATDDRAAALPRAEGARRAATPDARHPPPTDAAPRPRQPAPATDRVMEQRYIGEILVRRGAAPRERARGGAARRRGEGRARSTDVLARRARRRRGRDRRARSPTRPGMPLHHRDQGRPGARRADRARADQLRAPARPACRSRRDGERVVRRGQQPARSRRRSTTCARCSASLSTPVAAPLEADRARDQPRLRAQGRERAGRVSGQDDERGAARPDRHDRRGAGHPLGQQPLLRRGARPRVRHPHRAERQRGRRALPHRRRALPGQARAQAAFCRRSSRA